MVMAHEVLNSTDKGSSVILLGGETTPILPLDAGKGGRNQHYAAVSLLAMEQFNGEWVVASVGTDGSDYLSDVAGAIVDRNSLQIARDKNLNIRNYINRYDSYNLFKTIGDSLVITGDTGTNVGDVVVYVLAN
jgi:glycerate-2-kinase